MCFFISEKEFAGMLSCKNKTIPLKKAAILILPLLFVIISNSGCLNVVQNRDFISDGTKNKYQLSSYHSLDSTVNTLKCDTVITLERSGCLGKCPVFKLALLSNGSVYFLGRHNIKRKGIFDTVFNKQDLSVLISEFHKSGFFRLREKYDLSNCVGPTDLSSLVISIKTPEISKIVSFYIGCIDYSKEGRLMTGLASMIEDMSNVKSWIR